ncbi:DUF2267 domain-containing protein [Breoghania sp. L-A4]|uniref:DUF2267 domain-containing protein n=1 Tax=Breoghania sp. L-A4 TaxID=2304600 RepID=UPI000E35AD0D|nr:DUF2267 domain-containing protein [Breoghania sp. L-A4]AXS38910.1 DUF2267 domain-containing protein [Breoghania sp. L-A4]
MPMPDEYQRAGQIFDRFLHDAGAALDLTTRNQTYTVVQSVLLVFRRRLTITQGLRFADELPAVLRALFVKEWDVAAPPMPFAGRDVLSEEVRMLRRHHNFAPPTAIRDVARALRGHVDARGFDVMLATLPREAAAFWSSDGHEW